jgi:endonuclease/exonuclease/phosphatase family metal-dependent hydrolase
MGDFNARPDWDQIGLLTRSGWVDSWVEAGMGDGYTSSSGNPQFRIDYVFHTSDMVAIDAGVFQSTASDHLPVIVDIALS